MFTYTFVSNYTVQNNSFPDESNNEKLVLHVKKIKFFRVTSWIFEKAWMS